MKSDFDLGKPNTANTAKGGSKRGIYTFGVSRDHYQKVYLPEDPKQTADFSSIPGPGTYSTKLMTIGNEGIKYNIQHRTKNVNGKFLFFVLTIFLIDVI